MGAAVEHARAIGPSSPASAGRSRWRKLAIRLAQGAAVLYLCALVAVWVLLRFVSEGWWITTIGLYLPRAVLAAPLPFVALTLLGLRLRHWLWTQAAALVVLTFPVMGFVVPLPHAGSRDAPRVRLLSYNINSCNGGCDAVVAEVDRYSPDVVVMQEIAHAGELEQLLRARYPNVDLFSQFVLASRYPILSRSEPPNLPFNGRERTARWIKRVLDTPLGPIALYNVHPISPRDDFAALRGEGLRSEIRSGRLFSGKAAPLIAQNAGLRDAQVQSFSESAAAEPGAVIIAGDTNMPGLSRIFARYLSDFTDGFREAGWGLGYTYPNDRRPWMRIDRVLANSQLRFFDFEVGTSRASDHLCVVADVQRRSP